MLVSREETIAFFFAGMMAGWVNKHVCKVFADPNLPGHKCIRFKRGEFVLLDRYTKTPGSQKSAGTTTIFYENEPEKLEPIWVMNYGGWYAEPAIPCLKAALVKAYEARKFIGGRGPGTHKHGGLLYMNLYRENSWDYFIGREEIKNSADELLGFHDYWGMSLV